jgi:hypothetical protein
MLFPNRQKLLAQILKTGPAPQRECKVDIPEPKRAFNANPFKAHRHGQLLAAVAEKLCLLGRPD